MAAFTVSVIGQQVKDRQRPQALFLFGGEGEKMHLGVVIHKQLQRARAKRGVFVTVNGGGNQIPTQGPAEAVGGHFATRQRARRKIPQGAFALGGFVDHLHGALFVNERAQKGAVGAV